MRALLMALLLAGCTDYSSLSRVGDAVDGAKTDSAEEADLGGVDQENLANNDLAGAVSNDLAEADATPAADMAQFQPASCAEINEANPASNDGNFMLYFNHDASKPWVAWCKGMGPGSAPVTYLTLPQGAANNQSVIGADLPASGEYTKVQIDPVTLKVNTYDQTYNIKGAQNYGCTTAVGTLGVAYANAYAYCGANHGAAKIDLRGTPFKVAQDAGIFSVTGSGSGATLATYSEGDQVVTLDAVGPDKRIAATGGQLQLVY